MLIDSGYTVATFDQRAAGRSTGKYIGEGQYEGDDIAAVVSYLDLRGELAHPFVILGFDRGADGACSTPALSNVSTASSPSPRTSAPPVCSTASASATIRTGFRSIAP